MDFTLKNLKALNSELLELLTHQLPDMLWVKDIHGRYLYTNKAICEGLLMAKDTQEPIGKTDLFFAMREREKHKDDPEWHTFGELCSDSDQIVIDNKTPMRFEEYGNVKGKLLYLEVYKAPFYGEDGSVLGTIGTGRDISDLKNIQLKLEDSLHTLQRQSELLSYQANYDALTGLPNRTLFYDRLNQSIKYAAKSKKSLAVVCIDLDNFKEVNDLLGHSLGDKVLLETTRRLTLITENTDSLARLGGDEFAIILNDINEKYEVEEKVKSYMDTMKESLIIENNVLHVNMSIGIAMYPQNTTEISTLLQFADAAMYETKINGRNNYHFYDEEITKKAYEKTLIERELRNALKEDRLEVYYQPQINAINGTLVGMEALVRWNHPLMGMVYPERFIALAENNGMILELDRIVMKKAIKQFCQWHRNGLKPGKLSLNLSMKQIEEEDFIEFIQTYIVENGFYHKNIEFEITETQIMNHPERSIQALQKLSELGISLSVDDFGTGYSSLAYLKRLPINKLKIDKSFINELPNNHEDAIISKTIIDLAKNLNLDIIAEGVETHEQKDFLVAHGCEVIQGHYYHPPLSTVQMYELLQTMKLQSKQ